MLQSHPDLRSKMFDDSVLLQLANAIMQGQFKLGDKLPIQMCQRILRRGDSVNGDFSIF